MSLCNTFRSYAVYITIVIAVTKTPVTAFTIGRTTDSVTQQGVTAVANTSSLDDENELKLTVIENINKNPENTLEVKTVSKDIITSEYDRDYSTVPMNTDITETNYEETLKDDNKSVVRNTSEDITEFNKEHERNEKIAGTVINITPSKVNTEHVNMEIVNNNTNDVTTLSYNTFINTTLLLTDSNISPEDIHNTRIEATTNVVNLKTEVNNFTSYSTTPVNVYRDTPVASTNNIDNINNDNDSQSTTAQTTPTILQSIVKSESDMKSTTVTRKEDAIKHVKPVEEIKEGMLVESNSHKMPSWKRYTTIKRIPVTSTTEKLIDTTTVKIEINKMLPPENVEQSHVNISPKTYLREIKNETPNTTTDHIDISTVTGESIPLISEINSTNINKENISSVPVADVTEVESGIIKSVANVGGFLDLTARSTLKFDNKEITTERLIENEISAKGFSELEGAVLEVDVDSEGHLKRVSGTESQSQLVEDAIKEELLKEQTLFDEKYREERFDIKKVQQITNSSQSVPSTNLAANTDNVLSVKPITTDKVNSSKYAVNPNYKPLKKIEVQPPKPFVRDPDDNSWRNESISSLGIVFKPKNSSKPFTQVLRNKTETQLNSLLERDNRNEVPELRERLEKIAEIRKSKKKKTNNSSEVVYSDYEESSNSGESGSKLGVETYPKIIIPFNEKSTQTPPSPPPITPKLDVYMHTKNDYDENERITTRKPKKTFNILDYYESTDEDDKDYATISNIDLKRFTAPLLTEAPVTPASRTETIKLATPVWQYHQERKPTLQYFPPLKSQKVNVNDYDSDFNRKVNMFMMNDTTKKNIISSTPAVTSDYTSRVDDNRQHNRLDTAPTDLPQIYKFDDSNKEFYITRQPQAHKHTDVFGGVNQDGNYNKGAYAVKNFKDFLNVAAKDSDYDRNYEYVSPYTEASARGVTIADLTKEAKKAKLNDEYDYELQFRKDVADRFADNFNQNSERFKVDFPLLYNNSVVHKKVHPNGKVVAESSAFLKRLYDTTVAKPYNLFIKNKPYDTNCENITVELSPAYELHYYVPDQEEKEELQPKQPFIPYRFRYP